jgi:hypothetical protein
MPIAILLFAAGNNSPRRVHIAGRRTVTVFQYSAVAQRLTLLSAPWADLTGIAATSCSS